MRLSWTHTLAAQSEFRSQELPTERFWDALASPNPTAAAMAPSAPPASERSRRRRECAAPNARAN
jgi:hypothetical protein